MLQYQEYAPCDAVATYVATYWNFEASPQAEAVEHEIIPDGCISIALRRAGPHSPAGLRIVGPRATSFRVRINAGDSYFGIRFWPDAGAAALHMDACALRDQVRPAAEVLLGGAEEIMRVLIACRGVPDLVIACDALLPRVLRNGRPIDPHVRHAVMLMIGAEGDVPIGTLPAHIGIGLRQLQRRFRACVGLTMKEFARIRRVRAAAAALLGGGRESAARLAVRAGFSDQAHFIRELTRVTGAAPTALRMRLAAIRHRDLWF